MDNAKDNYGIAAELVHKGLVKYWILKHSINSPFPQTKKLSGGQFERKEMEEKKFKAKVNH